MLNRTIRESILLNSTDKFQFSRGNCGGKCYDNNSRTRLTAKTIANAKNYSIEYVSRTVEHSK